MASPTVMRMMKASSPGTVGPKARKKVGAPMSAVPRIIMGYTRVLAGEGGHHRAEQEDQQGVEAGRGLEPGPHPGLREGPVHVLGQHQPVVGEQGLHRHQGEDEAGELQVRQGMVAQPVAQPGQGARRSPQGLLGRDPSAQGIPGGVEAGRHRRPLAPKEGHAGQERRRRGGRIEPVGALDAPPLPDGRHEGGQPPAQVHDPVQHGVAHAGAGRSGELAHRRIAGGGSTCRSP